MGAIIVASFGQEEYDLLVKPSVDSPIVQAMVQSTLEELSMTSVIHDLERSNKLLYLAKASAFGPSEAHGKLAASLGNIHFSLMKNASNTKRSMKNIHKYSSKVLDGFNGLIIHIFNARENMVFSDLKKCANGAEKISELAKSLSEEYQDMSDKARDCLSDATILQSVDEAKRIEIENRINGMIAQREDAKEQSKILKQRITEKKQAIKKLDADRKDAENKLFALEIVGCVTEAVGKAAGAVGSVYAQSYNPGAALAKGASSSTTDNAAPKKPATRAPTKPRKPTKPKKPGEKLSAAEVAEGKGEAKDKTESVENTEEEIVKRKIAAAKAVSEAAKSSSDGSKKLAGSYASVAEGYRQQQLAAIKMQDLLEDSRQELLGSIAKLKVLIGTSKKDEDAIANAVVALSFAIEALDKVSLSFYNVSQLWSDISENCEELGEDSDLKENIDDIVGDTSLDARARIEKYKDQTFQDEVMTYYASWTALGVVADRFEKAAGIVADEAKELIGKPLNVNNAFEISKNLARELLDDADGELADLELRKQERDELRKSLSAEDEAQVEASK